MKCRMRLAKSVPTTRGNVLRGVDSPPAQIVHKWAHKQIQNGFGENTKDTRRQNLVIQLHGCLRSRVFLAIQIIGSMDLTTTKALAAIRRIQPADDVVVIRRVVKQEGKMFMQMMHGPGMDFQK